MNLTAGAIVLVPFPIPGGRLAKLRPALILCHVPGPFQSWLLAGVSTKLEGLVPNWDLLVDEARPWFPQTGLKRTSAVRLSYLATCDDWEVAGRIGAVPASELARLRGRLATILE